MSEEIPKNKKQKIVHWLKQKDNLILLGVLIFAFVVRIYYFSLTKNQPLWWDEAEYMNMASHIAGLAPNLNFTFDPVRQILTPLIMALFFKFTGISEVLPRVFIFVMSFASVIGMYYLGKEIYDKKVGLIASFLMSLFWVNLFFTYRILVDIQSLTFFIFSTLFFYKYFKTNSPKFLYIASALLAIGTLFKLSTAFLFPAILIYFLITEKLNFLKRKEVWIATLIFVLIFVPYIIWGYFEFHGFVLTMASAVNSPENYLTQGFNVLGGYLKLFPSYLSWPLVILFVIGLFLLYKLFLGLDLLLKGKNNEVKKELYLILIFLAPLLLTSFLINHNEDRYILNIFPSVFIFCGLGINFLYSWIKKKNKLLAITLIIILVLFTVNFGLKSSDNIIKGKLDSYSYVRDAGIWLKENSEPSDIIISSSYPHIEYYSGRETIWFPQSKEEFEELIQSENKPDYFMISVFETSPEWAYNYPEENNLKTAKIYFSDAERKNPVLIIYSIS